MNTPAGWLPKTQRFAALATLILVECVIWLNSANSGIARGPLLSFGAIVSAALMLSGCVVRRKMTFPSPAAGVVVLLHIPLFVGSALAYYDPAYTPEALAFGLSCIVFFLAGSALFTTQPGALSLTTTLRWLTVILCIVGAAQYFLGDSLPLDFHTGTDKRVASLFGNPEYFASFLVTMTPVMIARALGARSGWKSSLRAWILPAGMGLLLLATESRSGIVGCAASLLLFAALGSSRPVVRRASLAGGILLSLLVVTVAAVRPGAFERAWEYAGIHRSSSVARRVTFWKGGLEGFAAHPFTGHGTGSFERSLFQYRSPDYWVSGGEDVVPHAHNEIIEVAVEYGLPGLLLLAGTLWVVFAAGVRKSRGPDAEDRMLRAALVSGIAGVALDGLASVSLRQPSVALPVWMLMGFLVSPGPGGAGEGLFTVSLPRVPKWMGAAPLLGGLAGCVAIGVCTFHSIASDVHLLRGVLISADRPRERVEEYREAVAEMPFNLAARSALTLACLDAGSWNDALASAGELQERSPLYPKVHMMTAYALLRLGKPEDALAQIRLELGERSHPEAYRLASAIYRSLRDTLDERKALAGLLRADIRGGIPYEAGASMARLAEISAGAAEKSEDSVLSNLFTARFASAQAVRTP